MEVWPRNSRKSVWRWQRSTLAARLSESGLEQSAVVARQTRTGKWTIHEKYRKSTEKAKTLWEDPEFRSERGTHALGRIFGKGVFEFPKPVALVKRCLELASQGDLSSTPSRAQGRRRRPCLAQPRRRRTTPLHPGPTGPRQQSTHAGDEHLSRGHGRATAQSDPRALIP